MKQLFIAISFLLISCSDKNSEPTYSDSGAPKNCRAIIQANLDAWHTKTHTAEEALTSIDRNCGASGHSW